MHQIPEFYKQVPVGWKDLVVQLHDDLIRIDPDYSVLNVSESWGGLRIASQDINDAVIDRIHEAERASNKTCQMCGVPGTSKKVRGWYYTACDDCIPSERSDFREHK